MTLSTEFSAEHQISIEQNHSAFLALSQALKHSLSDRGVKVGLADVHESLAIGYGYKNYACYLEAMKAEAARVVSHRDIEGWEYFVVAQSGWIGGQDVEDFNGLLLLPLDEAVALGKSRGMFGSTLKDMVSRRVGLDYLTDQEGVLYEVETEGLDLTQFVVNYTFNKTPAVEKYGVPSYASYPTLRREILEDFVYKVCSEIDCDVHDSGDDSSGYLLFEVAVPADQAALIRERMVRISD